VGNAVIARVIDRIRLSVNEGKGMLEPMKESDFFPSCGDPNGSGG